MPYLLRIMYRSIIAPVAERYNRKALLIKWFSVFFVILITIVSCAQLPTSESNYSKFLSNINTICLDVPNNRSLNSFEPINFSTQGVYEKSKNIIIQNGYEVAPGYSKKDYRSFKIGFKGLNKNLVREGCDASLQIVLLGGDTRQTRRGKLLESHIDVRVTPDGFENVRVSKYAKAYTNTSKIDIKVFMRLNVNGQNIFKESQEYKDKYNVKDSKNRRHKAVEFINSIVYIVLNQWMETTKKYADGQKE